MIIVDWNATLTCSEYVWDSTIKQYNTLDNIPKIWSSSTLYSEENRVRWFQQRQQNNKLNSISIFKFHHSQLGVVENSILMKRKAVETLSSTSVKKIY